jgi:hypothetical protein
MGKSEDEESGVIRALTEPMRSWGSGARWAAVVVGVLVGVSASLVVAPLRLVFDSPDSSHYLKIAVGHTNEVMQPWASRQLGARVAAELGTLSGGNLHAGFWVEAMLSLVVAMGVTCWIAARTAAPRWMLLALMLVPSWPRLVEYLVLPDLWYAGLLAVLLLLLSQERYIASGAMMLPLMLSRESTSLTLVCFLAACWPVWKRSSGEKAKRWLYAAIAVLSAAAGSLVVARLVVGSQANKEHLPQMVYMFAKVPWNFMRNVLGVLPWSDANSDLCKVPVWSVPFHFGPVHALGTCGFSIGPQMYAIEGLLTNFGLLPLLVAVLWWRHRRREGRSALLRFALLYGGVCFVLSPVLGAGVVHLMQYAWPLFLIATPLLLDEFKSTRMTGSRLAGLGFTAVHLALPAILLWPHFWPRIVMAVALWGIGWVCLRGWLPASAEVPVSV